MSAVAGVLSAVSRIYINAGECPALGTAGDFDRAAAYKTVFDVILFGNGQVDDERD